MEFSGYIREPQAFFPRLGKIFRGARDECCRSSDFVGAAAQARAEALPFRFFARVEENYVLPQRAPRRARRPAIYVRGAHGQDEFAVGAGVALESGAPILLCFLRRDSHDRTSSWMVHRFHARKIAQRLIQIYPEKLGKVGLNGEAQTARAKRF